MAATYDTVGKIVDIALEHLGPIVGDGRSTNKGDEIRALHAMLVDMNHVAQGQKNKSVRDTFTRFLDEVNRRMP